MYLRKKITMSLSAALICLSMTQMAEASLTLLQPDPLVPATFVGNGGYSADGLGQSGGGGTIQAEVPAGSTVVQAYLYGTYYTASPDLTMRTIDFDGTLVELSQISTVSHLSTARVDVTVQVAAKVGAGGGITDFAVNNDPAYLDGVALVVLYSNPALPDITVAVLDGSASQTGDVVTFNFVEPLDKTVPGFSAIMSLGSGFSSQGVAGHICGGGQTSIVDVNTQLLTNCAGNYDDGLGNNGALITVGGVGDSLNNPTPPDAPAEDDELYDLEPFLVQGDTGITITSSNPSQDDNLFLSVIAITAKAAVTTEICDNGIDDDGDGLIDGDDPDCPTADYRKMTGGGLVIDGKMGKVKHGVTLSCDFVTPGKSQNLQVNWGKGNKFHLEGVTFASCTDDESIEEGSPVAGWDTYTGTGTGRYNGVSGATAEWIIQDAGEPGKNDTIMIKIMDKDDNPVLDVSGKLKGGNHQAH